MTLGERIRYLWYVFYLLQSTNSINEKRDIVDGIESDVKDDFLYCIELLAGKRKIGYTYESYCKEIIATGHEEQSVKEYLEPLFKPSKLGDYRESTKQAAISEVRWYPDFVSSIVNRTLRLGIGNCLLEKEVDAPMLAKKYEGKLVTDDMVYITEKLDGNRCIAKWNGKEWTFTSRNGKAMYVDIDMGVLNKDLVYDGEILSKEQTNWSIMRYCAVNDSKLSREYLKFKNTFNSTSGMINRHNKKDKDLVYNIFDIQDDTLPYATRRAWLNEQVNTRSSQARILPVLGMYKGSNELSNIDKLLDDMADMGAEGLMLNLGRGRYESKRSGNLLKYKKLNTMDMKVVDWEYGNGKYECAVGNLIAECTLPDGREVSCKIGTGISDEQRFEWATNPSLILGKIIEVAYFELSQNSRTDGTKQYSLRFPRMKSVRNDKKECSPY